MDGNKRIGHAAMEVFLKLNGFELGCPIDEQEGIILKLAAGKMDKKPSPTGSKPESNR